jgi:hypothetical protein
VKYAGVPIENSLLEVRKFSVCGIENIVLTKHGKIRGI